MNMLMNYLKKKCNKWMEKITVYIIYKDDMSDDDDDFDDFL